MARLTWVLLACCLLASSALAQQDVDGSLGGAPEENRVEGFLARGGGGEPTAPGEAELLHLDEAGRAALTASLTAYYRYRETGFEHRRAVFDWQLVSSKIIFAAVILLVGVGLYFSWLQFMVAGAGVKAAAGQGAGGKVAGGADLATTVEASAAGIKVSSPVLGVIILMISLAFFYLYLVHVYPISEVF